MTTNGTWDEAFDFVIVGSGGGSMCAALAAKQLGKRALIVEKQPLIGGSTGFSGGVWWVPNNPVMKRAGVADSAERARQYLDAAVTYQGPGTSPARRDAFLRNGPKMVEFLEDQGMKFVYADGWSDYYDELPGGEPRGRSLLAELFDTRELGEWESKLSRYKGFSLPLPTDQFPTLMLAKRTWRRQEDGAVDGRAHAEGQADRPAARRRRRGDPGPHAADRAARAAADLDRIGPRAIHRRRRSRRRRRGAARRPAGARAGARRRADERRRLLAQRGDAPALPAPARARPTGPMPTPATPARRSSWRWRSAPRWTAWTRPGGS